MSPNALVSMFGSKFANSLLRLASRSSRLAGKGQYTLDLVAVIKELQYKNTREVVKKRSFYGQADCKGGSAKKGQICHKNSDL